MRAGGEPGAASRSAFSLEHTPSTVEPEEEPEDLATKVLEHLSGAVQQLGHGLRGPRDCASNRKRIARCTRREGATLADWRQVIDAQLENVRGNPDTWRYLCLPTICRPDNWARLLEAPVAKGTNGSAAPPEDPRIRVLMQEGLLRDQAIAWLRDHG